MTTEVNLFSYGSLRRPEVQRELFGRVPDGSDDVLPGYTVDYREIDDERVAHVVGTTVHPIVRATGSMVDKVLGRVLRITEPELEAADELESLGYTRRGVVLASGTRAWVYVAR